MTVLLVGGMESLEPFGFPGYAVDADGVVWTCLVPNGPKPAKQGMFFRAMKSTIDPDGYLYVRLRLSPGRFVKKYVHQLVALVFLGECPPGRQVRHFDGNPGHNHAGNLRYGTQAENEEDKRRHGR